MDDLQIEVLKWLAIFVFACGTACAVVGAFLVVSVLARTGVDNALKAVAYANDLPHNFKKLRAIVKEHDRLRAENERLLSCRDELRAVVEAMDDPSINNTRTLEEAVKALRTENERLRDAVIECLSWMRCDCGHPHCGKCRATREADAALAAKGE